MIYLGQRDLVNHVVSNELPIFFLSWLHIVLFKPSHNRINHHNDFNYWSRFLFPVYF